MLFPKVTHTVFTAIITLFTLGAAIPVFAQTQIQGRVVDATSRKGIDGASVQLFLNDSMVQGVVSANDGRFSLRNIVIQDQLVIEISVLGYAILKPNLPLQAGTTLNLGDLEMEVEVSELKNVVVTSTRPALQMSIDKKIFTAERALNAKGGTAIDVLRNIPSITVDVDGSVQMRNASPQIFVDGRPTILTLDQIPADDVETVELITNPSAKYDAASGGGIINVVLKKNRRRGLNGTATAGIGTPGIYNGGVSLNLRQGALNFFGTANFNRSGGIAEGSSDRTSFQNGVIKDKFSQQSENERLRNFGSTRFGVDWFMDVYNSLSVSQGFTNGTFGWREIQQQQYMDASGSVERLGERLSPGKFNYDRTATQVNYKRTFPKKGREVTMDFTYNTGEGGSFSDYDNKFFTPDGMPLDAPVIVTDNSSNNSSQITFQADYIDPIGDDGKIEAGFRSYFNDYTSRFNTFSVQNDGSQVKLPLSNYIKYTEQIHAGYINYAARKNKWSYQTGLRMELSSFDGELPDSAKQFGYRYPDGIKDILNGLFPSAFLTYEVSENQQVQFNYTRRIRRPNFWQLNPFVDITDPLNIRQGNINIRPETVHSFELNFNQTYKKGSLLAVLYFKNNVDDITQFSDTISAAQLSQLGNAGVAPNAILNTFVNADFTNRMGTEITLMHKINENFEVTPTFNLQYRKVKAEINGQNLSNEGLNWEGKLMLNYKVVKPEKPFWNNFSFQLMGEYESPQVIPQGRRLPQYGADLAIRKDFLKDNKASLVFAVNDIFDTRRRGTIFDTPGFYQESFNRWNVRSIRLTLSYKFGRNDFQLFQRKDAGGGGGEGEG